ncbi:hypothetical protein GCM10027093_10460 [Paraburkholderia jirisanensis]
MSEQVASTHFKLSAARGLLDAALIVVLCSHVAAWLGLGLAFTLRSWPCVAVSAVSVLVAALTLWLLIRVTIDRRLFAALVHATVTLNEADGLGALDQALLQLGWIDQAKAGRSLDARVRGVTGLLRQSVGLAVLQLLIVAAAAWWGAFP